MPDTLWLAPGISVPRPDDGAQLRYSAEEAERVLSFFRLLVFGQNEWAGRPFELLPWEEQFIREFFGIQVLDDHGEWVRYRRFGYDEIPKKNGKTEFNAGLGLYFLLADGESRPHVAIFAVDKINADILYQCAKYMVEHTAMSEPKHRPMVYCRDSVREIRTRFGGLMKVYSSDAEGKHGYSFSAILCDEIHAWRGLAGHRLWTVLTQGTDAARRQQAVLVMTTAGDDPDRTAGSCTSGAASCWPGGGASRRSPWTGTIPSGSRPCTASASSPGTTRSGSPSWTSTTRRCGGPATPATG